MHSYSSFVLYPYSFDSVYVKNWRQHEKICQIFADTVNRITNFNLYTFGNSATQFYAASGVSDDFAVGVVDSEYSLVVELPYGGEFGYDFPEQDLFELVRETFEGIKAISVFLSG
jgi:hypothetical protein